MFARLFISILSTLIYISGCTHLNNRVREACTHGNCKHDWNSKDTFPQRLMHTAWALGMPALLYIEWRLRRRDKLKLVQSLPEKPVTAVSPRPVNRGTLFPDRPASVTSPQVTIPTRARVTCPVCGGPTVRRVAKRGRRRGNRFYGCVAYPRCHGTLDALAVRDITKRSPA